MGSEKEGRKEGGNSACCGSGPKEGRCACEEKRGEASCNQKGTCYSEKGRSEESSNAGEESDRKEGSFTDEGRSLCLEEISTEGTCCGRRDATTIANGREGNGLGINRREYFKRVGPASSALGLRPSRVRSTSKTLWTWRACRCQLTEDHRFGQQTRSKAFPHRMGAQRC